MSGSIQTMFRWQNAEVINFFTDRSEAGVLGGGTVSMDGFSGLLQGVLLTRLLGISLTKMSNHLDKHGPLKMSVALKKGTRTNEQTNERKNERTNAPIFFAMRIAFFLLLYDAFAINRSK
jgi:hypothetical protein